MGTEDATLPNPGMSIAGTRVLASDDGVTWAPIGTLSGPVGAIAYGGAPVTTGAPAAATPSPAPSSSEPPVGECSTSGLQAALTAGGGPGTVGTDVFCSGRWAAAGVDVSGNQITAVFEWVNGAWQLRNRDQVCSENVLPPELVPPACGSN
jgi:hypothetical protein